jgi:hypothetical protein
VTVTLQVPIDMVCIIMLGSLSAATNRCVKVKAEPDHINPTCLWTAAIADPGTRKSPVVKYFTRPIREFEKWLIENAKSAAAEYRVDLESVREEADRSLEAVKAAAAEVAAATRAEADGTLAAGALSAADARLRLEAAHAVAREANAKLVALEASRPVKPRLIIGDATPEAVAVALCDHRALTLVGDEPTIWATAAGRYSTGGLAPVEVFLQAYSGSLIKLDRRGLEGTLEVDDPALSAIVTGQVGPLLKMVNNRELSDRGFVDRWLIAYPASNIGFRDHIAGAAAAAAGRHLAEEYNRSYLAMAQAVFSHGDVTLELTPEALTRFVDWKHQRESSLAPGAKLHRMRGIASKREGEVPRIAAVLHVAHAIDPSGVMASDWLRPIPPKRVEEAISIVEWAMTHTAKIVADQDLTPATRRMRIVLDWVRRSISPYVRETTRRDIFNGVRSQEIEKAAELIPVLDELVEAGWMMKLHTARGTPGRPSERWLVHSSLWSR